MDLYVVDTIPDHPRDGSRARCFDALDYDRDKRLYELYRTGCLGVGSYTVVAGSHIWVSTERYGTFAFDTERGAWSKGRQPAPQAIWKDVAPAPKGRTPETAQLVHLGSARFCVVRFFENEKEMYRRNLGDAVLTAVEVERRGDAGGGLRMVHHGSDMVYSTGYFSCNAID